VTAGSLPLRVAYPSSARLFFEMVCDSQRDDGGRVRLSLIVVFAAVMTGLCFAGLWAQTAAMPTTAGETLSGKKIVLASAVRGHSTALVAGFSHEGGTACGDWMKTIRGDLALAGVDVYEIAMLEGAPGLIRGMIKSGMRKGMSDAEQERSVVLTQDEKLWERYFEVLDAKVPYVMLIDRNGDVVWRGHGAAAAIEPQLRNKVGSH
jgi:hypothetical protein